MKENNKSLIISVLISLGIIIILTITTVIVISRMGDSINNWEMEQNCCNGNQCSDTYYNREDNTCHLVLCENALFSDKEDCVYLGKGIKAEEELDGISHG